jgi:hypothetical protein
MIWRFIYMRAKRSIFFLSTLLFWLLFFAIPASASQNTTRNHFVSGVSLTFEERVAYQRAVEEVYWRHRIWPKENPGPKPPLAKVMPDAAIAAKVEDYLRKSNALEQYWNRPITAEQLQAEMDRMVKQTKHPAMLRELFEALNNDPSVIAECLARPLLVDRFIHSFYENDERFHGTLKAQAESDLKSYGDAASMKLMSGAYQETVWKKKDTNRKDEFGSEAENSISLDASEWQGWIERLQQKFSGTMDPNAMLTMLQEPALLQKSNGALPINQLSTLQEDADRFYVTTVLKKDNSQVKLATVEWKKRSFEEWWSDVVISMETRINVPSSAYHFSASLSNVSSCIDDTWRPILELEPRARHTAVWTGSEMIVWGGRLIDGSPLNSGARYNPSTDTWIGTSMYRVPSAREEYTAIWTGSEMIIWGGSTVYSGLRKTGGRYNPLTDSWKPTSTDQAPVERFRHTAIWTGSEMIVWGGLSNGPLNSGGRYNPITNKWVSTGTSLLNAPSERDAHTAIWTGTRMIIWGGENNGVPYNTGGLYDPSTDTWAVNGTSTINAPSILFFYTAIWTGAEMIV